MKRLFSITLVLAVILANAFSFSYVKADAGDFYLRVITADTPFYSDANGTNPLFYLPYSYYVKILSSGTVMTRVEIYGGETAAIDGYVPTSMLFNDGLEVKNPYVNLEIITASTTVLYADSAMSVVLQYVFPSRGLRYYGSIPAADGLNLFFVGYNGKLGYVKESEIIPFAIPDHPNEATFLTPEPEPDKTETQPKEEQTNDDENPNEATDNLRIIIICCLLLAGIVALFVALKSKPQNKKPTDYYDENYFE